MDHTVFAVFSDTSEAEAAVDELIDNELCGDEQVSVISRRGDAPEQLEQAVQEHSDVAQTHAGAAAWKGALLGAAVGAVVAGPFGLIGGGPLVGVLFGVTAGSLTGLLGGGLAGLGVTDPSLKELAENLQRGDTLLAIHADSREREQAVEKILSRHGARIAEKHRGGS